MVRDFRYIIKRIIVGVGIALILGLIRGNLVIGVKALSISSVQVDSTGNLQVVDTTTRSVSLGSNWGLWTNKVGYVTGSASVYKVSGSSTSPILLPRYVVAVTNSANFACSFDSVDEGNSTFNGVAFSFRCPVNLDSGGLQRIQIGLTGWQANELATYRVEINNLLTFEEVNNADEAAAEAQVQGNATRNAINNASSSITNNQNSNTQSIINNQNSNTQQQIESQKVCKVYDKNNIVIDNQYIDGYYGSLRDNNNFGITDYIKIENSTIEVLTTRTGSAGVCFYNINKTLISCIAGNELSVGIITIPTGSSYFRASINKSENKPTFKICTNGNQAIADSQQEINNTLNNDNVDGAESEASSFFDDFQSDSHGLSGIITAPLRLLNSLSSSSCSPLTFPLPFVQNNVSLPCMSSIYQSHFSSFLSLYQLITTGVIGYWVLIKIFGHIKGMQNPKDDRIEVFDL